MNCLNPITIYNKSENISFRGSSLVYQVPCCTCANCRKNKENEYKLRSFIEYQSTLSKGGFVYFDTLTYNNANLPKTNGISHFRKEDIQMMIKKLRVYLNRDGYDAYKNLKYFVTSEYGGKKHRPHYHCIFYISFSIDVKKFWRYLNKAWIYGFIDRMKTSPKRIVNSECALNYVAKYITKDQSWIDAVDEKVEQLQKRCIDPILFKNVAKQLQPFFLSSKGYGKDLLKFVNIADILKNGYISIKDRNIFRTKYAIPMYYTRKLFYDLQKKEDGSIHWHLNDFGINYKVNRLDEKIAMVAKHYETVYNNIDAYNINNALVDVDYLKYYLNYFLKNRTFSDFAKYLLVYRNKLYHPIYRKLGLELPDYKEFYRLGLVEGKRFNKTTLDNPKYSSYYKKIYKDWMITQDYCSDFEDFDELYKLFKFIERPTEEGLDKESRRIARLRSRLKLIITN